MAQQKLNPQNQKLSFSEYFSEFEKNDHSIRQLQYLEFDRVFELSFINQFGRTYLSNPNLHTVYTFFQDIALVNEFYSESQSLFESNLANFLANYEPLANETKLKGIKQINQQEQKFQIYLSINDSKKDNQKQLLIKLQLVDKTEEQKLINRLEISRNQLMGSVTHELKAPLMSIEHFADVARSEDNKQSRDSYLSVVQTNCELLRYLIYDILDFCQIKEDKLKIIDSVFSIKQLIKEIKEMFLFQIQTKNLELIITNNLQISQDLISNDRIRVKQILINLVQNSIKFTEIGFIEISLDFLTKKEIKITVTDSGAGMSSAVLDQIGLPYCTFNTWNMNKYGIGLGLYTCNKLLPLLGSWQKFQVHSQVGQGSRFAFAIANRITENQYLESQLKFEQVQINQTPKNLHNNNNDRLCFSDASPRINFPLEELPYESDEFYQKESRSEEEKMEEMEECECLDLEKIQLMQYLGKYHNTQAKKGRIEFFPSSKFKSQQKSVSMNFQFTSPQNQEEQQNAYILIVDDNQFIQLILFQQLQVINEKSDWKIQILKASNGQEAVVLFEKHNQMQSKENIAVIIMDFDMPIMNGFEATQEIKQKISQGNYKNARIIGYSSNVTKDEELKAKSVNMDLVLPKPQPQEQLIQIILKELFLVNLK